MNLLSHERRNFMDPNKFSNWKPSKFRNVVKICIELVTVVNIYGCLERTLGSQIQFLQEAKSVLEKNQRAKRKCWGQQVVFGTNFMKFGPKRANLATLSKRQAVGAWDGKRVAKFRLAKAGQWLHHVTINDKKSKFAQFPAWGHITNKYSSLIGMQTLRAHTMTVG